MPSLEESHLPYLSQGAKYSTQSSYIFHRSQRNGPHNIVSGSGVTFTLEDGRRIIDASAGPAVACLGHHEPRVTEAIVRQMQSISYVYSMGYTSDPAEALAADLLSDQPGGLSRAIFVNSGSEATDAALKLASQYWIEKNRPTKQHFIARRQSYHGNTLGALSVSGHESRRATYAPWMSTNVTFISPCYPYRDTLPHETPAQHTARLLAELEATILTLQPSNVAAFILETIPGSTLGCVPPSPGYLAGVRAICTRHNVLLILDEIMCGMGKTGYMHAWQAEAGFTRPDIQTIGKALGGGFVPISGVLASAEVYDAIATGSRTLNHGHTFQAHPVACAAALEVQRVIRERGLLGNVGERGRQLERELRRELIGLPRVGDVRGRGLFWSVEFVVDPKTKRPFLKGSGYSDRVVVEAQKVGLNVLGSLGHTGTFHVEHVIISPPYIVSAEEITEIVRLLKVAIQKVDELEG